MALPAVYRLILSRSLLSQFYSKGTRRSSQFFSVLTMASNTPQVAVVVGTKISKRATQRNYIKRKTLAVAYVLLKSGFIKGAVVLYPRKTVQNATLEALKKDLSSLFV